MKFIKLNTVFFLFIFSFLSATNISAQISSRKPQNLPFADQKLYHFGFFIGMHTQDMTFTHTGYTDANGQAWFSEIPSYSPGFSVGLIADRYLSQYFNIRISPALHFGEKKFKFKEQLTGAEYEKNVKSNYLSLPIHMKFSAARKHNARPYLLAGPYLNWDIGSKKGGPVRYKTMDFGLEFGLGCNIYLPFFKLAPELRFSLGLTDVINSNKSDITDNDMLPYRNAIKSGKTRMISLIFNFE